MLSVRADHIGAADNVDDGLTVQRLHELLFVKLGVEATGRSVRRGGGAHRRRD
jgi:hypothetical protein